MPKKKLTKTQVKKHIKRALDNISRLMEDRLMQPSSNVPITIDSFRKLRKPLKTAFNRLGGVGPTRLR